MNPKDYVFHIPTGSFHAVAENDPIRKRADMRTPTQAEVDARFGVKKAEEKPQIAQPVADAKTEKTHVQLPATPELPKVKPRGRPGIRKGVDLRASFLEPGEEL